ncbi:MAG: response regulator transcription factor [Chitinophagaceae bacterium]|nr:response regulator transcription factor [Chitinophagaceae bacterium]
MHVKKILLFEDNTALRTSLIELLQLNDEYTVVGAFDACTDVENQLIQHQPDVILMDIDLPGMTGIEAVRKIRLANNQLPIIMLTVFEDGEHVLDAICAGASGYLLKKDVSEKLSESIREVFSGGAPMSGAIAKMVISAMHKKPNDSYGFTKKETEILHLLCKGNSYKMIAAETGLAFETIRSYIKKIYEKLQVHSATEAVSKALHEKIL